MPDPVMMFDNALDVVKGGYPRVNALDVAGKMHSSVTVDPVPAGRVVHIAAVDSSGKLPVALFKPGANGKAMPIFLFNGTNSYDVSNPGGTRWYAGSPSGVLTGVVATGGWELETTEFDSAQSYPPNTLLRAIRSDSAANAGMLTSAGVTLYTNLVVGCVSFGVYRNHHGRNVLRFWPVYLPGSEATT